MKNEDGSWREWAKVIVAMGAYSLALGQYFGSTISDLRRAERDIIELKTWTISKERLDEDFHRTMLGRMIAVEENNKGQSEDIRDIQGKVK